MPRKPPKNKIEWTPALVEKLKSNYHQYDNRGLSKLLGVGLTSVRMKCYELGLYRMELEYWTKRQINFLVRNYKKIGDTELAELLQKKWPKKKGWTLKHVEKKRKYLGLKRTADEVAAIRIRNVKKGRFADCPVKRWKVSGQAPVGELRIWNNDNRPFVVIKTEKGFVYYNRWLWRKNNRRIRKNHVIRIIDPNKPISIDNLRMVSFKENQALNAEIRKSYPEELKHALRLIKKLNKTIYGKEQTKRPE